MADIVSDLPGANDDGDKVNNPPGADGSGDKVVNPPVDNGDDDSYSEKNTQVLRDAAHIRAQARMQGLESLRVGGVISGEEK